MRRVNAFQQLWSVGLLIALAGGCERAAPQKQGVTQAENAQAELGKPRLRPRQRRSDYGSRWAVVIGIDKYRGGVTGLKPLKFGVRDAAAVRDLLRDEFGYKPSEGKGGREAREHIRFLSDEEATQASIRQAFEKWLPDQRLAADDAVLVFFAGHGLVAWDDPEQPGYLAAVDSTANDLEGTCLSVEWLKRRLAQVPCRHKVIILDSCYSGSLFESVPTGTARVAVKGPSRSTVRASQVRSSQEGKDTMTRGAEDSQALDEVAYFLEQPAFVGLSAARDTPAADELSGGQHSLFTSTLLQVMRERADSPRAGHVFTFGQLAEQVKARVGSAHGSGQIPKWGRLGGGDGDFVFRPTVKRPTPTDQLVAREYAVMLGRISALLDDDPVLAAALLESKRRCPEVMRDFTWRFLRGCCSLQHDTLETCAGRTIYVRFSPQGTLAAAELGSIKLWDTTTGEQKRAFIVPEVRGPLFVNGSADGTFVAGGFSGDASGGRVVVWKCSDGDIVAELRTTAAAVALSGDGRILATSGYDKAVQLWDRKGETDFVPRTLQGHEGYVTDIVFSPDCREIATASLDGTIKVWNVETGSLRGTVEAIDDSAPGCLVYSADGTWLVSAYRGEVAVWDASTLTKIHRLEAKSARPQGIAMSPDGRLIAIAGGDARLGVKLWSPSRARIVGVLPAEACAVAFSSDGRLLVAGCTDGSAKIWPRADWSSLKAPCLCELDAATAALAITRRGDLAAIASLDRRVRLYKVRDHRIVGEAECDEIVTSMAFREDGKALAVGSADGVVRVFADNVLVEPVSVVKHEACVIVVGFLSDGRLWTACEDGVLRIWGDDLRRSEEVITSRSGSIVAAAVDSDGQRWAIADESGQITVRDRRFDGSGNCIRESGALLWSLAFSPDGESLVGCGEDGFVGRWMLSSPSTPVLMVGHEGTVWQIGFADSGTSIVTAGEDATVRFWDPLTGDERGRFKEHAKPVTCMAMSASGLVIITGGRDHAVRLWVAGR